MESLIYNRRKLEIMSHAEVAHEHPEWMEARQKEIAYSDKYVNDLIKRLIIRDFAAKLITDDGGQCVDDVFYKNLSKWIVTNVQPELIQNINEYIDSKDLSPIEIHGVTIVDLMKINNPRKCINFIDAISALIYWKESNYHGKDFCYQFLMR